MEAMDSGALTVEEFIQAFELIMSVFKELKVSLESELSKGQGEMSKTCESLYSDMVSLESRIEKMMRNNEEGVSSLYKEVRTQIDAVKSLIPTMPDLSKYESKLAEIEAKIPVIKDAIQETPEQLRDKLESIKVESEKLDIDAIGYLREELDKLEKKIGKAKGVTIFGGGSSGGGRMVKAYDLTSSLNGVLKTFTLPAFWKVISVHSSSFPYVFRPTTDYTTDASAMSITFTSEILADTTLATGQTLLIIYAE